MEFTTVEQAILEWCAINALCKEVANQFRTVRPTARTFTGVGSFTDLALPDAIAAIPDAAVPRGPRGPFFGPDIRAKELELGACTQIFCENGRLSVLEIAAYGNSFPEILTEVVLAPLGRAGTVVVREELNVGTPAVLEAFAPDHAHKVVFEDDGETGYFYALDPSKHDQPIQDAVLIYKVDDVRGRVSPSVVELTWSSDNQKAALLINGYPHAVFDFSTREGYARSGFPSPHGDWSKANRHNWNEMVMGLFA